MIKKRRRISRNAFKSLTRPSLALRGELFTARVFKTNTTEPVFSVSVSKKIDKRAVYRNKMRRIAYSAIKNHINTVHMRLAVHFILNNRPKDLKNDINKDINALLSKI